MTDSCRFDQLFLQFVYQVTLIGLFKLQQFDESKVGYRAKTTQGCVPWSKGFGLQLLRLLLLFRYANEKEITINAKVKVCHVCFRFD